ncbi:MAG: hypothetical protein Ta2E_10700 [Mycoplasmoidaceae bacterium]|nr:MAG: hypothetical protein Ta2E_10700 [Mycoplasmoidaceae bacterium]
MEGQLLMAVSLQIINPTFLIFKIWMSKVRVEYEDVFMTRRWPLNEMEPQEEKGYYHLYFKPCW